MHRRRDHGGLIFIDLRDRTGIVQLVFHPEPRARGVRASPRGCAPSTCCQRAGEVVARDEGNVNPNIPTGEIELAGRPTSTLLATSETPPFPIDEDAPVDEMLRLRHRMLDLRRERMRDAIVLRHEVVRDDARRCSTSDDFLEIETPILTRSTPEGARDFLVPSRG